MHRHTLSAFAGLLLPALLFAQDHKHEPGMTHPADSTAATSTSTSLSPQRPGQAAFGAIAEVVAILTADPKTDWSKVNIEALRQHLMDMDDVTIRSTVVQQPIAGGARFTVTGTGRVTDAIRRMANAHAAMVGAGGAQRVTVEEIAGGARVTVVATQSGDGAAAARIRGLGFIGMLTLGGHHGPHHLAMARGDTPGAHRHEP
jgi:hypothetical protein